MKVAWLSSEKGFIIYGGKMLATGSRTLQGAKTQAKVGNRSLRDLRLPTKTTKIFDNTIRV